jgi:deoxyribodipyrimidine photo-lyase
VKKKTVFWFRRDLRIEDNCGLFHALSENEEVIPIFIFDQNLADSLNPDDKRIQFIYNSLNELNTDLSKYGSSLLILNNTPAEAFKEILKTFNVQNVYCNEDYEPYAIKRDKEISDLLLTHSIVFKQFKDQVVFSKNDILKKDSTPYTVFTAYKNKWRSTLRDDSLNPFDTLKFAHNFIKETFHFPGLNSLGFVHSECTFPPDNPDDSIIAHYDRTRDFPALEGTSRLSIHFRFGTVSIRKWIKKGLELNDVFLNELIWREFYMMILFHFPHVVTRSFKPVYDKIEWRNNISEFEAWCIGNTGYPFVDAGMRELNATDFMHNRARMITASFLTKHLLCDWRMGEAYFAEKLLDFELASNNGGWQWSAGTGCDAAPYFRIFNPQAQALKFDSENNYIKKWVAEVETKNYRTPIVEHTFARERCLKTYKSLLS